MARVDIIGRGNMGQAIAGVLTAGGSTVEHFGRDDKDKPLGGDVVVLAIPYPEVANVLADRTDELAGKVVVDITNPLNFQTFDSLTVPADGSATAEIAAALPQSQVVKAFNTTFGASLGSGSVGSEPTTVLIAGDDADAKSLVSGLVEAGGLRALDAGALSRARELESIGLLQVTLAAAERIGWTGGFALVK